MTTRSLQGMGVLGINRRNRDVIQRWNPRRAFPTVDDKIRTKELLEHAGVTTPRMLGTLTTHSELRRLGALLEAHETFVLKPAQGSQGNGILVVTERRGDRFITASGRSLRLADIRYRASQILSGLFSLGGREDKVLLEECLTVHPRLTRVCVGGTPDIRIIVYRGLPVMAMTRLPTRRSGGRANLHHGAVGAGIHLSNGKVHSAIQKDRFIESHPDSQEHLMGLSLPGFPDVLVQSVRAADCTEMGYVGVDVVLDEARGPMVLEINARPGLSIQLANRSGLTPRLNEIDRLDETRELSAEQRIELARKLIGSWEDIA